MFCAGCSHITVIRTLVVMISVCVSGIQLHLNRYVRRRERDFSARSI